ncbi:spermatogenesis-associated protein 1 [Protopterus annectens]|uniref:spermatogenesis-associated protein 1 n=1 Tax=Protopterus annectens TaxID=7888 RepID=UPI001CFA5AC8|nr:spermatogenesis-associated protein 1 [Protopterus annectens]
MEIDLIRTVRSWASESRILGKMELKDRTASSRGSWLLELHIFCVPDELWDSKLNTVPMEFINKFISFGFIRVHPDTSLQVLREQLEEHIGEDVITDKFLFLKSVGRRLAVVRLKQESELKIKAFAPPYAPFAELYLLPRTEHDGRSVDSQLYTPEQQHNILDYYKAYGSPKLQKNLNPQKAHTRNAEVSTDYGSYTSRCPEEEDHLHKWREKRNDSTPVQHFKNEDEQVQSYRSHQEEFAQIPKRETLAQTDMQDAEIYVQQKDLKKTKIPIEDSTIRESLWDRDAEYLQSQNIKSIGHEAKRSIGNHSRIPVKQAEKKVPTILPSPVQYDPPPAPPLVAFTTHRPQVPLLNTDKEKLSEQLRITKHERMQLEKTREDLMKKARALLAENQLRRNQARDAWKKKYFDTKKATAPLEETLSRFRQDLEMHYKKLIQHLEARDVKKRSQNLSTDSIKNELIIKITEAQQATDKLKRKVENAKMKLVAEIKLRKQAAGELRALKAELAQKKIQSSLIRQTGTHELQKYSFTGISQGHT